MGPFAQRGYAIAFLSIPFAAMMLLDRIDLTIFSMMWLFEIGVLLGFEIRTRSLAATTVDRSK